MPVSNLKNLVSLTALALGRLRMSTSEFLEHYRQMSREIFGHWRLHLGGLIGRARYDERYLEQEIKLLVNQYTTPDRELHPGEQRWPSLELMRAPSDLCKT